MRSEISERKRRALGVIIKSIIALIAIGITLWLAWVEFDIDIFMNKTVISIMAIWLFLGFIYFLGEISEAMEKSTNESVSELTNKIDELIKEIKEGGNGSSSKPS